MKYLLILFLFLMGCDEKLSDCDKLKPVYGKRYEIINGFYTGAKGKAVDYKKSYEMVYLELDNGYEKYKSFNEWVYCSELKEIK